MIGGGCRAVRSDLPHVAIHATLGPTPQAAAANMNVGFVRRPPPDRALIAECRLLRVGRSLVVGEVSICYEGSTGPVAHEVGSHAVPRERPQPEA